MLNACCLQLNMPTAPPQCYADMAVRAVCLQTVPEPPSEIDEAPVASVRQKSPPGYKVFASPATKHLAKENNIDLKLVTGTGPEGRITRGKHFCTTLYLSQKYVHGTEPC